MATETGLINRVKGQRRVEGVCWCCCSDDPVRPCAYWLDGIARWLCKRCERTQAVLKPCEKNCTVCKKKQEELVA
jgi:hypothetical protein